jgi:hypothetical protein
MAAIVEAVKLAAAFQRAVNYPRDPDGVAALAAGLKRASEIVGVSMRDIVRRCSEQDSRCPTDNELLDAARAVRGPREMSPTGSCPLGYCDGSGWRIVWTLHTVENGRVSRENITESQAADLQAKVDGENQRVYSGARRCDCEVGRAFHARDVERKTRRDSKRGSGLVSAGQMVDGRALAAGDSA